VLQTFGAEKAVVAAIESVKQLVAQDTTSLGEGTTVDTKVAGAGVRAGQGTATFRTAKTVQSHFFDGLFTGRRI
jgi:hypothetical protein